MISFLVDSYVKHAGKNCGGLNGYGSDLLRDFLGTEEECKAKGLELDCPGFIRVHASGKCYFRSAPLKLPILTDATGTDCFLKEGNIKHIFGNVTSCRNDKILNVKQNYHFHFKR